MLTTLHMEAPLGQFRPKSAGLTFMRHIPRQCLSLSLSLVQNSGDAARAGEGQKSDPPLTISDSPSPSFLPCQSVSQSPFRRRRCRKPREERDTMDDTHVGDTHSRVRERQLPPKEGGGDDGSLTLTYGCRASNEWGCE